MDYISQIEKLYKYLSLSLEAKDFKLFLKLKKTFNNDLNLMGCYIKDFLTLENSGNMSADDKIYDDFILYFEGCKDKSTLDFAINKLVRYSNYYLTLVFEDTKDRVLLSTIASVNSCFNIEYYPFLMEIMDKYKTKEIDSISYALILQYITDTVFKNFEQSRENNVDLQSLRDKLESFISYRNNERAAI